MSDKVAVIQATFSDFRIVKGRKIAQLVCEVPLEQADVALATLGGLPQPAAERWVALARLDNNVQPIKPQQEKRRWEDLKLAAQASIRCTEPAFWRFLQERNYDIRHEEDAAAGVRHYCDIDSRSALNLDEGAAAKWRDLDAQYQAWLRLPA